MAEMNQVREAVEEDVPFLVDLFEEIEEKDETAHPVIRPQWGKMQPTHVRDYLIHLIKGSNSVVLFTENAVCAGGVEPHPHNLALRTAIEYLWRSNGRDGSLVLTAFEEWAVRHFATHITISTMVGYHENPDVIERFMGRRGYQELSVLWQRSLI